MFTLTVNCPHCDHSITDDWFDYIVDSNRNDENRYANITTSYAIECDNYLCPECNKTFYVSGFVQEYPAGEYYNHELNTEIIE